MSEPITLISAGLTSFAHLNTLVKTFFEARDRTINLEQVNALQSEIASVYTGYLAMQQQYLSLVAEKDNLEKEIANFKAWENEAKRYKLIQIQVGVLAYALKESDANGEPPHWICADCCNKGKKFILSQSRERMNDRHYKCTGCGFCASIHQSLTPQYA